MTISTAECELTITFTEEEHGETCDLNDGGCSRQALWRLIHAPTCECIPEDCAACNEHRASLDAWLATLWHTPVCWKCRSPDPITGWEPIGWKS